MFRQNITTFYYTWYILHNLLKMYNKTVFKRMTVTPMLKLIVLLIHFLTAWPKHCLKIPYFNKNDHRSKAKQVK